MTDKPPPDGRAAGPDAVRASEAAAPAGALTGVAAGSLGTASNLDETQVLRAADMEALEAERGVAPVAAAVAPVPVVAETAPGRIARTVQATLPAVVHPVATVAPSPEPVVASAVRPATAARPARSTQDRPDRSRGLAGVLVVALIVVAGLALLTTSGDGLTGVGGTPPQAGSTPTAAPATEKPGGGGNDKGKGKGNDKGNGNGGDNDD